MDNITANLNEAKQVKSFANSIRSWLSIELSIKIFGVTILHWKFPPDSNDPVLVKD